MPEIDLGPVIGPRGPQGEKGEQGEQGPTGPQGEPGVVDMDTAMEFTEAGTRANINSGESLKTILGKIKKYFTDLKPHAFKAPANNFTTTDETTAAAAPTVKQLKEDYDALNSALAYKIFGRDYGNIQRLELNMPIGTSALIIPQFGMYFVMRLSSGQFEVYEFSKTGGDIQHVEYADAGYIAFKYGESGDSSFRCLVLSTSSAVVPR